MTEIRRIATALFLFFYQYSTGARIVLHILFWLIMLELFIINSYYFFGDFNSPFLINVGYLLVKSIASFYFICYIIIPKFLFKRHFVAAAFTLYIWFVTMSMFEYVTITFIASHYSTSIGYNHYAQTIEATGLFGVVFNLQRFFTTLSNDSYSIFPPIMVKVTKMVTNSTTKTLKLEKENLNLEYNFLKSQINPHFLFNTLNNIYSMIVDKDTAAAEIIVKLSQLMRYSLYETGLDKVWLVSEINFLRDYIYLESIRHSDNVQVQFEVEGNLVGYRIAPLLLVSFVENAFKHGVNRTIQHSWVKIHAIIHDDTLYFSVQNSQPKNGLHLPHQGGIGVLNVIKRLELLYHNKHSLVIDNQQDIYSVSLTIHALDSEKV